MNNKENGTALLTVMYLVAVTAILAFGLLSRQQLDIRRTAELFNEAQAQEYALGAEEWARQILTAAAGNHASDTTYSRNWAQLDQVVPTEHGSVSLSLEDLHGRFNLNVLAGHQRMAALYFTRLLSLLNLPPNLSIVISAAIRAYTHSMHNGENHYIASVTYLRSRPEITADNYQTLAPYLTALPEDRPTLSVNSASDTLLKAFAPNEQLYQQLLQSRNRNDLFSGQQLRTLGRENPVFFLAKGNGPKTSSDYFGATARAKTAEYTSILISVIARDYDDKGQVRLRVISRSRSPLY